MKKTHRFYLFLFITMVAFSLAACGGQTDKAQETEPQVAVEPVAAERATQDITPVQDNQPNLWGEDLPRIDEQGAVTVEVNPLNPSNPGQTLDFSVSLNTHSVDLSMDLAALATLETDNGYSVQATFWDAPLGGHHVSGILSFPSMVDGSPLLEGASKMTLTLVNVDAPERIFVWER